MELVVVAIIVAISTIIGSTVSPLVLVWVQGNQRREDKREDWARQDLVSERAEQVALQAAAAAQLLLESNKDVADAASKASKETLGKLEVIHTLVNSNMTAQMQSELDATVRELAGLKEIISLKQVQGIEPSVEALAAIETTENKIAELTATLRDRLQQTKVAEEQAKATASIVGGVIVLPNDFPKGNPKVVSDTAGEEITPDNPETVKQFPVDPNNEEQVEEAEQGPN